MKYYITNRVDIDKRPEAANNRARIGDWEGDTMIGKEHKGVLVTLDDRRSKLRLAAPLKSKHGKEFSFHKMIAKELDCNACFAKPYHSWERGQNENTNGLLR